MLWRGDALCDVTLEGHAEITVTRLDAERRLVGDERIDCALALGQHLQLIPELEHRVHEAPLHERARAQLMLALYRAGRQNDALERYREGRVLLVEQAGIEPGRELRELERAILTQDPGLELPHPADGNNVPRGTTSAHLVRRRLAATIAAALVVLLAVVAVVLVRSRPDSAVTPAHRRQRGGRDRSPHGPSISQVPVGVGPGKLAAGFGLLWVVNEYDSTLTSVDPRTGAKRSLPICEGPTAVVATAGSLWVTCSGTHTVDRIDPVGRSTQRTRVGNGPSAIAVGPRSLWVANRLDDTVTELDAQTGRVRQTFPAGPTPTDIAYGFRSMWITNESSATVTRLDPATGVSRQIPVPNGPEAIAIGAGSVWTANSLAGNVTRIDPDSDTIRSTIPVGSSPSAVLVRDGQVWATDSFGGRIVRIAPASNSVAETLAIGSAPQSLVATDGHIWASTRARTDNHRGGTLRLYGIKGPDSLDAATAYSPSAWSILSETGDGLVGYKRVGGLDGNTLVPDLATSLVRAHRRRSRLHVPAPARGQLLERRPVRASDFRRALERVLRIGADGSTTTAGSSTPAHARRRTATSRAAS